MDIRICDIQKGDILKGIFFDHHYLKVVGEPYLYTDSVGDKYWRCKVIHTKRSTFNGELGDESLYYINADTDTQDESDFYEYATNVELYSRNNDLVQKYLPKKLEL